MIEINESVLGLLENVNSKQKERIVVYEQSADLVLRSLAMWTRPIYYTYGVDSGVALCYEALKLNPNNRDAQYWLANRARH